MTLGQHGPKSKKGLNRSPFPVHSESRGSHHTPEERGTETSKKPRTLTGPKLAKSSHYPSESLPRLRVKPAPCGKTAANPTCDG